jgi:hypothetical protein
MFSKVEDMIHLNRILKSNIFPETVIDSSHSCLYLLFPSTGLETFHRFMFAFHMITALLDILMYQSLVQTSSLTRCSYT